MYNKSPRMGRLIKGDTPDNVGPTTYSITDCLDIKDGYCPFLSCTTRGFSIGNASYTDATYDAKLPFKKIKGGDIPRASRFKGRSFCRDADGKVRVIEEDTGPGPGSYDPKIMSKKCKFIDPTPIPGKGRLYVCRPPFSINGNTCPSIPTKIDENGYDLDENDMPVKVPRTEHDQTLGPAFYDVQTKPCWNTRRYKGCQWSKRLAKRKSFDITHNPSPAEYDVKMNVCKSNARDEYVREMARLFSYVPRYTEATEMRTLTEDLPGPASYDINNSTLRDGKSMSIRPVPMVTGAKRFGTTIVDSPGPGDYSPCLCYRNRKDFYMGCSGFNNNAPRFNRRSTNDSPGPAFYDVKGPLREKLDRKRNCFSMVDAPFCQTAKRKLSFVNPDQYFMPGPANYPENASGTKPSSAVSGPTFRSRVRRFPRQFSETAEPATYSISEAFHKNRNRTSHNTGKAPFLANDSRPPVFGRQLGTPGPADYMSQGDLDDKGLYFSCDFPRFPCNKDDVPGPGTYIIDPCVHDSFYKAIGTHNVKLRENVVKRIKSKSKEEDWDKIRRKNKVLRWFIQPSVDYRHCVFVL